MAAITITQSDIEAVFGAVFVAQWSNVGAVQQSPTANAARITAAIARGVTLTNGRVNNGPYLIPLTANDLNNVPVDVIDLMATYAGIWLFRTSGINYKKETLTWIMDNQKRADLLTKQIVACTYQIDCQYNTLRRQTPQVVGCR